METYVNAAAQSNTTRVKQLTYVRYEENSETLENIYKMKLICSKVTGDRWRNYFWPQRLL
jgi:hypothetical protein